MASQKDLKTIKDVAEKLKGILATQVEGRQEEIIQSLIELATGIWVHQTVLDPKTGRRTKVKMYQKEPDKEVAQYLLNQFVGKPKQNVEVAGNPDQPLVVTIAQEVAAKYNLTQPQEDVAPSTEGNSK